ncbi:MAG TPA: response regulator transcription factor, partial [Chitinophagales bacterium]|nr:response regulator transcription factor [Chitinophagales bacterium]
MTHTLNILIADDHRMFAETMKMLFEKYNMAAQIDIVGNGKEAIDRCLSGQFDLVILDISMPLIDGIEALKEIRRHKPDLKVLMVTMLTEYEKPLQALEAGARGVVSKKSDTEELINAIRRVLNNEIVIPSFLSENGKSRAQRSGRPVAFTTDTIISPRERDILKLISEGLT